MFEIFSTREIATAIYGVLFFLLLIVKSKTAKHFVNLIKTVCKRIFIVPVLCLFAYAGLIVYGLQFIPLWDWVLIKDVIIWVLFVATPICFKAATKKIGDYPFCEMVIDNFVWTAFIEFFVGSFTFSFLAEMFVVPVFTLVTVLQSYDRNNPKFKSTQKVFDGISIIAGLLLLIFTVDVAIDSIAQAGVVDVLVSFAVPVIFSVLYLPVVYFLAVKGQYHDLFGRMRIRNKGSTKDLRKKKRAVVRVCGLSYKKVQSFARAYVKDYIAVICKANDDDTFLAFVVNFKKGG